MTNTFTFVWISDLINLNAYFYNLLQSPTISSFRNVLRKYKCISMKGYSYHKSANVWNIFSYILCFRRYSQGIEYLNLPLRLFQLLNLQTITYKKYVPLILNYCIIYPKLIKVGKDMSDLSLLKIAIPIYFF